MLNGGGMAVTTLREHWLILILLLAMIATAGYHYKQLLTSLTERTVAQIHHTSP